MQGGDLSNEIPRRAVVTIDCILNRELQVKKVLGFIPKVEEEVTYNLQALSRFFSKVALFKALVG